MKKVSLFVLGFIAISSAQAQFSVGANANYTMYKQDFQKSTPGVGIRAGYEFSEKNGAYLGFTYGSPIKENSELVLIDGTNGNSESVPSEINYKFKTVSLWANRTFVGDAESTGKFYGSFGASFVMVNYKEEAKEKYGSNLSPVYELEGKENGFTINLGLGGEYKIGKPAIFAEAGIALPANKVGNEYVENYIPTHFTLNLGVRLSIGGGGDY